MLGEWAAEYLLPPCNDPKQRLCSLEEWVACDDPIRLLRNVYEIDAHNPTAPPLGAVHPRRFRLLAAEVFEQLVHGMELGHPSVARAFAVALRNASWLDGFLPSDWRNARRERGSVYYSLLVQLHVSSMSRIQFDLASELLNGGSWGRPASSSVTLPPPCTRYSVSKLLGRAITLALTPLYLDTEGTGRRLGLDRRREQVRLRACELIRESFRGPQIEPVFRAKWRTSDAIALFRLAEKDGSFGVLPILADALQDAGCDDDRLLEHLRSGAAHHHGCWALEAVRG
jgi:hypothetical protein